jgi:serine/threonine protein phosphatase PrpC
MLGMLKRRFKNAIFTFKSGNLAFTQPGKNFGEKTMAYWKAVAQCSIGIMHLQNNLPCQDFAKYEKLLENSILVGAVADGAGSAKFSDIGSQTAVESAVDSLKVLVEKSETGYFNPQLPSEELAKEWFTNLQNQVLEKFMQISQEGSYSCDDLACTLLVFIATPDWMAAMQIGDGFIVVRYPEDDYELLFQPHKGEYVNETTFVTSKTAIDDMQVKVLQKQLSFICVATDGLEQVACLKDWTPYRPFFEPLEDYLTNTEDPEKESESLERFLNSERLNKRTNDDKTILLAQLI